MVRVLVTRPEPDASRTARRLETEGFQSVLLPLTETRALPVEATITADAAAVAVTSANAVRHAPNALIAALARLPCHAVGKRTAEACRAAGFSSVTEGQGDAEALADAIAGGLAGKAIVYLCGRVRFPAFERRLAEAGMRVQAIETYDTTRIDYGDAEVLARLSEQPVGAALLYSAKASAALSSLIARPALKHLFEKTEFLALSSRVAEPLDGTAGRRIRIAPRPDEDALLALLSQPR
ncbi:uroporphyrinogen-III synthase [Mesorhizobium sp. M2D.F.Ca.ET.185.01.1.1]|uniref:uroporphyrinogen-III synthase n=2 Tax=Mesorhizobium TaxID=68287 RepID=UPI000FCBBCFB|nr:MULTISPECIES: uroporphyrinogen-III synthase [unclassified Mesorhizobium]TGP75744.1 uroporphyrinogen-III synthase [bacterium M00.F.Ca.ET.227.01.1.1]TGP87225.1 uroporphyrinogen-III synthase [bacterium M00.F.Ca.ET.221.01.1.1]TGP91717.1 uroporphyrinogen-III synthase [bacterium M00.F.Ca.ET.222.01.1.1]TGT69978.1 uroporphyrinogen-III synthase [bacterium M00.F.Ca.ET.159.01.1.1]TGT81929.1 uroporphyrinogen-III synthase [bacterium M00.F.Ca.ET.157.01.1.1]TGU05398.1 uroporphyrinogen-III synthase [bacte